MELSPEALTAAFAALDQAHDADPKRDGPRAAELVYVERVEAWIHQLVTEPSTALRLAARAQHLERWAIPRADYPMDKVGYHAWRRAIQQRQGTRAQDLLTAAGLDPELTARVAQLVSKSAPRHDPEAQALEDAACLVFFAHELPTFAADHPDYTRDKHLTIVQKTWRKMSPAGQAAVRALSLPEGIAAIVQEAVG